MIIETFNFREKNEVKKRERLILFRGGSRTAATSKIERFVIIVNGFQPLTINRKRSVFDVAAVLDPSFHYKSVY